MNCRNWAIKALLRQNVSQQREINKIRRYLQSQFWRNCNIKEQDLNDVKIRFPI